MKWETYQQLKLKNMTIVTKPSGGLLMWNDIVGNMNFLIYKDFCEIEELPPRPGSETIILWKIKVMCPDGSKKLASIWPQSQSAIIDRWGTNSKDWVGFTLEGFVKAGQKIITFFPADIPRQDIQDPEALTLEQKAELENARAKEIADRNQPPTGEQVNAEDIPFRVDLK